jgi:hypothetical protein
MNGRGRAIGVFVLGLFFMAVASADTLTLRDGRVLRGRYLGGTQTVLRFEINGEVQAFNVADTVALTFTGNSAAGNSGTANAPPAAPASAASPAPAAAPPDTAPSSTDTVPASSAAPTQSAAPAPVTSQSASTATPASAPLAKSLAPAPQAQDAAAQYGEVTIPAGQSLLVRMIDGVDSSRNHVGDVFHASLETDLYVNNIFVARKGTDVYGRLANAQEAGPLSGSAELQLELMRIVIDGRDYALVSSDYSVKGQSRGADTAKKVGGGAIFGAIIGAIAGGGRGAAIGAGAGSATGAGVQVLTRGQQVRVPSETLLEFRLQQPAMVTPAQR